jgi:hypothetical protein
VIHAQDFPEKKYKRQKIERNGADIGSRSKPVSAVGPAFGLSLFQGKRFSSLPNDSRGAAGEIAKVRARCLAATDECEGSKWIGAAQR